MPWSSVGQILNANDESLARFLPAVTGLTEEQECFRPAVESWSIAEIVEHVALVNRNFLRIIARLYQQAIDAGAGPALPLEIGPLLSSADPDRRQRVEAPERVRPQGTQSIPSSVDQLHEAASGLRTLQSQLEAVDLSGPTIPHFLGQLNAYQWLVLLGEHQDRHLAQIGEIKASPGYPVKFPD